MKKYQILLLIALIFAALFVFYPSLSANFINLDDPAFVEANWKIMSFSFENVKALLFDSHYRLFHPVVNLSFAVEYYLFGNDPYIYHATNLTLHLFSALFIFFIFMIITGKNFWISIITTLIFACHPMHVEAVAWVSGRKDVLYTVFFLAAILIYLKAQETGSKKGILYAASTVLFLFACLSKSMAVTLPAILILIDWFMGKKFDKLSILKYMPHFAASAIFSVMTYIIYYGESGKHLFNCYMFFNNFIAAHFHLIFYLVKFIWPTKLAAIYPLFYSSGELLPDFIMLSPVFIYMLALLIVISLYRTKKIFFGFAFFIITILPVINILPTSSIAVVADRYTYVPYIGLAFIAARVFVFIYEKIGAKMLRNAFIVFVCVVLAVMCVSCRLRVNVWQNTAALFDSQISTYPGDVCQAYGLRAIEYINSGELKKAEKYLMEALRIRPNHGQAIITLAGLRIKQERLEEALALYGSLPSVDLNITLAYVNMMFIYDKLGEEEKAEEILNTALNSDKTGNYIFLYYNVGRYYARKKNYEKALEHFQIAKKVFPSDSNSYFAIGAIYEIRKEFILAGQEYIEGLINCRNDKDLLFALGTLYLKFNMYEKAEQKFLELIKHYPSDYIAYNALGTAYSITKKYKEALFCYTMAILIKNDYGSAYFHRAALYLNLKQFDKVAEDARRALKAGYEFPEGFEEELKSCGIIL